MGNLWYKIQNSSTKKRHTLHSLCVGFVFFAILFILTKIFSGSLCPIKKLFGVTCLGCGMTRGFISILNFNFQAATKYNVLSVPLFISIVLYFICSLIDIIADKNYIYIIEKQLSKRYMYFVYIIILIIANLLKDHL